MTDTRVLLNRIAALRQRLELNQARPQAVPASADVERAQRLERQLETARRDDALIDGSIRQLGALSASEPLLPRQLTARARRLLVFGQALLARLRELAEHFRSELPAREASLPHPAGAHAEAAGSNWSGIAPGEPLAGRYRETVAMLDTTLRTVQGFPDSASVQLKLCEGLEGVLDVVAQRTAGLQLVAEQKRRETLRFETLLELLRALADGQPLAASAFIRLAEALLADAEQTLPARFVPAEPYIPGSPEQGQAWLDRTIAGHSLNVAQFVARLVRHDPDLRGLALESVLAALVHDVGMLQVPLAIYLEAGPLGDEQRRTLENHARAGSELAGRLAPSAGWLVEAAGSHHERQDGTGYPSGLRELQITPMVRLLAVCDVYAALCAARPHRPAREPRTALTDTLLLADKGALDRTYAEKLLLLLSFYPTGTVVELADGAIGIVAATAVGRCDLSAPARPVLALLTDARGQLLPFPRFLNLMDCAGRTIVRTLAPTERRKLLGKRYPELV